MIVSTPPRSFLISKCPEVVIPYVCVCVKRRVHKGAVASWIDGHPSREADSSNRLARGGKKAASLTPDFSQLISTRSELQI